jgi:hypothetical protein
MNRILPLSLVVVAFGCSEFDLVNRGESDGDFGDGLSPDIECTPGTIDFGELKVIDSEIASQIVTCYNYGEGDLKIQDMYISGDDLAVYTVSAMSSTLIQSQGSAQFSVTYTPTTDATNTGSVIIESDDPDEPSTEITLIGDGIAPDIDITPETYDFGTIFIGCETLQEIEIRNVGRDDLVVDEFNFNTASIDFSFESAESDTLNGPLPWTLAPGESAEVFIEYYPLDEFADTAYLFVVSNDPFTPEALAKQDGEGELYGENTDIFEQPLQAATDILFAADKSCSMGDDLANVQSNFAAYTSTLDGLSADYRVAIIVQDSGAVYGGDTYIDESNADDAPDIAAEMLSGSEGGYTEMAFTLLSNGISQNSYWFRDDAKLNLVGVSDEPEQSSGTYSTYVSYFQELKDDEDDVVIHAIGGDYPGGCATAEPYTGMYEATVATGGSFLSICATDWGAHLEELAENSAADLNSFELSEYPVPETIVVAIDSTQTTVGWDYEDDGNMVVFDNDHIPEGGSIIEIAYAIQGDCDY